MLTKKTGILLIFCLSFWSALCQTNTDTIEIKKSWGTTVYFMNGKQINPLSKESVLTQFPSSDEEYKRARLNHKRAVFLNLGGAGLFLSTSMYRGSNLEIPMQIVGGTFAFPSIFLTIKA